MEMVPGFSTIMKKTHDAILWTALVVQGYLQHRFLYQTVSREWDLLMELLCLIYS